MIRRGALSLIIVSLSTFTGLICFEYFLSVYKIKGISGDDNRYMFFKSAGSVFVNHKSFFLYEPKQNIQTAIYYSVHGTWTQEFAYAFDTNNFGLVQPSDLAADRPSLIVLGDSFTEGMGAKPWFPMITPVIEGMGLQAVNGGILGTGFSQWVLLADYLRDNGIHLKKAVVVFISDDYERLVWNFPSRILDCLSNFEHCDGSEGWYQIPPPSLLNESLERYKVKRASGSTVALTMGADREQDVLYRVKQLVRGLLPRTYRLLVALKRIWFPRQPLSDQAIRKLIGQYGVKNVVFVHLPTAPELSAGPTRSGLIVRSLVQQSGAVFYDGFEKCGLSTSDYYVYDGHPNVGGYKKIALCVGDAVKHSF